MILRASWWIKVGLLGASVLAMEGLARVYVSLIAPQAVRNQFSVYEDLPQRERRVTPHHYLCYTNTAGYQRGLKSHNSLGWRGTETTLEKPPCVTRVVMLGGSTIYTEAVEDNAQAFPAQLQHLLNQAAPERKIEVINAGVPGYNSAESLINLCFRVLEMQPDWIVVHHGANDVHCRMVKPATYRADNRGRRKYWQFARMSWLERHSTLYRILSRLHKGTHIGLEPFVDAPGYIGPYSDFDDPGKEFDALLDQHPPIHYRNNLRNMLAIAREHGVQVLLTSWAWCDQFENDYAGFGFYQRGFRELNATVESLATEKGVPYYDFASEMSGDRKYWHDGRHVNADGAHLKAQLFARFIQDRHLLFDGVTVSQPLDKQAAP